MNKTIYTRRMKLAQLIGDNNELLSLLQRLDIKLGFGEATVEDICRRYNLSTELFLMICNIYSFRDYEPQTDILTKDDITHITNYLQASHNYYKQVCFPSIHDKIHSLVSTLDDVSRHLIDKFYDDYDCEVRNHFKYEESIVFPYIESLLAGTQPKDSKYNISKFEKSHSYIGEKLNDLKNIIIKYLPEESCSPLHFEILKEIYITESDLQKHSLIENRLLVSLVEKLEKNNE